MLPSLVPVASKTIHEIHDHERPRGTYGSHRVHAELAADPGSRRASRTGLVQREFTAAGPDRLRAAGITYVPTWAGSTEFGV